MSATEPQTTAGYYKLEPTTGELLYGPTRVESKTYTLTDKDPVIDKSTDGWRWYTSRKEAKAALAYEDPPEKSRPCADCPLKEVDDGIH